MLRPIRVVIVDDSTLMRQMLKHVLDSDRDIEVVGSAGDPFEAREVIKTANPDVVTLDVEMPKMDGIAFLEKIMTLRPMPVIMVSSLTRPVPRPRFRPWNSGPSIMSPNPPALTGWDSSGCAKS